MKKKIAIFRKKLILDQVLGAWFQLGDVEIINLVTEKKYDFFVIDFEHGLFNLRNAANAIRIINLKNKISLCRISNKSEGFINQVLDLGCDGIIFSNTKTSTELSNLYKNCNYAPSGRRNVGYSLSNKFGLNLEDKLNSKEKKIIISQIESIEAVNNFDEMSKLSFVDSFMIGPYDLSTSLGVAGNFKSKKYVKILRELEKIAKKNRKPLGIHIFNELENIKLLKNKGYRFIAHSTDGKIINKYYELLNKK